MKLLVFAHTPPPHHGQSYMVQLLLEGLRNDPSFEIFHVNTRLSSGMEDIGTMRVAKLPRLLKYCAQAISLGVRHGVRNFYYVPASPTRAALYRDWIVMLFCRPFFSGRVFHWHAAGLADWLDAEVRPWERWITKRLMSNPALSIVLRDFGRRDAAALCSRRVAVIPNGTPDPCPHFDAEVLPRRLARHAERRTSSSRVFRVLYIGLCTATKGIFDALDAIQLANQRRADIRFHLQVAGAFWTEAERREFEARCASLKFADGEPQAEFLGFISESKKKDLMAASDCLCFPTFYHAENAPAVLVESMAFGLPVITTNWRMISEMLPPDYPGVVDVRSPEQIARKLVDAVQWDCFGSLRKRYLHNFTPDLFWPKIKAALLAV